MPSNPASTNVSDQTSGIYLESPEEEQCEVSSPNSIGIPTGSMADRPAV